MKPPRAELLALSPHYDEVTAASECARPDLLWASTAVHAATRRTADRPGRGWVAFTVVSMTAVAAVLATLWLVLA